MADAVDRSGLQRVLLVRGDLKPLRGLRIASVSWFLVTLLLVCVASTTRAQQPVADTSKCDSIVFASRVDSQKVSLYVAAGRADLYAMEPEQARSIATTVATVFVAPTPFRVSVFSGPAALRSFRRTGPDTTVERRAPTVTGVYRFWSKKDTAAVRPFVVRASLIHGFDSAAIEAIVGGAVMQNVIRPPTDEDSMLVEVRFSTDSTSGAIRMVDAVFPRMPVVDAVPLPDNPRAVFPDAEKIDSSRTGEVVLRFVVDREGMPALETVEIVRATSLAFARAALITLPDQRFKPARIKGCAVAQAVFYPFVFVMPEATKVPPRH